MEEFRKKTADEIEKDVIFSHAIKAGKRIYYMDVRKTRKDEMYLSITESKKIVSGEGDDAQVSFEKHKILFIHEAEKASGTDEPAVEASADNTAEGASDFKIEF